MSVHSISFSFSSDSGSKSRLSSPLSKLQINERVGEAVIAAKRVLFSGGTDYEVGNLANARGLVMNFRDVSNGSSSSEDRSNGLLETKSKIGDVLRFPKTLRSIGEFVESSSQRASRIVPSSSSVLIPSSARGLPRSVFTDRSENEVEFQGPHIGSPTKVASILHEVPSNVDKSIAYSKKVEEVFERYLTLFEKDRTLTDSEDALQYIDHKTSKLLPIGITSTDLKTLIMWGIKNVDPDLAKSNNFELSGKKWSCLFHWTSKRDLAIYLVGSRIFKSQPVRRAWCLHEGGKRVSLKTFSLDVSDERHQHYLDSLKREYETLSMPPFTANDVPLQKAVDFFKTETDCVMIGKLYHGDLFEYLTSLKGESLSFDKWSHIASQIIQGLELCHRSGIFYGDLKLDNLFYEIHNGLIKVYLADFAGSWTKSEFQKHFRQKSNSIMPYRFHTKDYCHPSDFEAWVELHASQSVDACWRLLQAQDVYALGRVLMYAALGCDLTISTDTNPLFIYDELVTANIPEDFAKLIYRMLLPTWTHRPTMEEIAKFWDVKPLAKKKACIVM